MRPAPIITEDRRLRWHELWNLAGLFTVARLPVAIAFPFVVDQPLVALGLYVAGVLTDVVDGYIARHTNTTSYTGAMIDGVLDKVLHVSVALSLVFHGDFPAWWLILWFARDYFQAVLVAIYVRGYLRGELRPAGANRWGKWTTVSLSLAMVLTMLDQVQLALAPTLVCGALGLLSGYGNLTAILEDRARHLPRGGADGDSGAESG